MDGQVNKVFLRDKRVEYMVKLVDITTPLYLQGIISIYDHVKKHCKIHRNILKSFQEELRAIKDWNEDVLSAELKRFKQVSNCSVLENLIKSIFKIYYITNGISDAVFPSCKKYVKECYLAIARQLYKNPYLLYDQGINPKEKRSNIMMIEDIIRKSIQETFIHLLPMSTLDDYENGYNSDDIQSDGDDNVKEEEDVDEEDELQDEEEDVDEEDELQEEEEDAVDAEEDELQEEEEDAVDAKDDEPEEEEEDVTVPEKHNLEEEDVLKQANESNEQKDQNVKVITLNTEKTSHKKHGISNVLSKKQQIKERLLRHSRLSIDSFF
jgi:hypothetical protein